MVSLKDYIENYTTVSIIDLLKDIDKDKVFVHSHYRSFPKRKQYNLLTFPEESSIPKDSPFTFIIKRFNTIISIYCKVIYNHLNLFMIISNERSLFY